MSGRWRSASLGSQPIQKPKERSRAGSTAPITPEVRCACQFFQSDSLLPDRINPVGSRSSSRADKSVEYYKSDYNQTLSHENLQETADISFDVGRDFTSSPSPQRLDLATESSLRDFIKTLEAKAGVTDYEQEQEQNQDQNQEINKSLSKPSETLVTEERNDKAYEAKAESKMHLEEFIENKLKQEEEARRMAAKPPQLFVSRLRDRSKDVYIPPQRSSTEESIIDDLDELDDPKLNRKAQSFRTFFQRSSKDRPTSKSLKHRPRSRNRRQQERQNYVSKRKQSFKSWLQKGDQNDSETKEAGDDVIKDETGNDQENKKPRRSSSFTNWLQRSGGRENRTYDLDKPQDQIDQSKTSDETQIKKSSWFSKNKPDQMEMDNLKTEQKDVLVSNQNLNTNNKKSPLFRSLAAKKEQSNLESTQNKENSVPNNISLNIPQINITDEHGKSDIKKSTSFKNLFHKKELQLTNIDKEENKPADSIKRSSLKGLFNKNRESADKVSQMDAEGQLEGQRDADVPKPSSFKNWFQKKDETQASPDLDNKQVPTTPEVSDKCTEDGKESKFKKWFPKKQELTTDIPSDIKTDTVKESSRIKNLFQRKEEPSVEPTENVTNAKEPIFKNWFQKKHSSNFDLAIDDQQEDDPKPSITTTSLFQKKHEVSDDKSKDENKQDQSETKVVQPVDKEKPVLIRPQSLERPGTRQYSQHRSRADERPVHKLMEHYDRPEIRRAVMASPKRQLPSPTAPIYVSGAENDNYDPNARDHEYESIGDPDSETGPKPTSEESKTERQQLSSSSSVERKQLPEPTEHDEQVESDRDLTVEEMQKQIEDKYFKKDDEEQTLPATPVQASSTHEEGEKPSARTVGERSRDMQRRFKNQAGKLKTKIQGIKKPTFTMPARKKPRISDESTTETTEKTPKLSPIRKLTDFKMPERPKISMPQFKMPDKSKFKMPERPHLPDFKMPERPKMPDFKMPDFKMPEMPEFKMPNLKRHNSMKEPPTSSESTAESKKRLAFDFKTYPRIFSKKQKDDEFVTSSPKEERMPIESATVPRAAARKKGPVGARWVNRFTDIKFVDDGDNKRGDFEDRLHRLDEDYKQMQQEQEFDYDEHEIHPDSFNESMASEEYSGRQHRYWADEVENNRPEFDYGVKVDGHDTPSSNQEERGSSGDSYEKRRRGVLEEIDADEFFLRQRGISQDDIEVGKYLSSEIRDAFKTPVNALEQVGSYNGYEDRDLDMNDYSESRDVDEDIDMEVSLTPLKPERTRSLRRQKPQFDETGRSEEDLNGFNTFPPNRPRRQKKVKKPAAENEIPVRNVDREFNDENDRNALNKNNLSNFDNLLYENQMMKGKTQPDIIIVQDVLLNDINRRLYDNEDFGMGDNSYENEENMKNLMMEMQEPPKAPKRKRKRSLRDVSASSEPGSIINAQFQDDWPSLSQLPADIDDEVIVHRVQHEYVIPLAESEKFPSPTPPRRTRSRSLTSRATTAPDEDRTSHGAESLISDNQSQDKDMPRNILDMQDGSGYAVIRRTPSVPKRRKRFSKSAETRPSYQTTPRMKEPPPRPPPRRQSVPDLRERSPDITQYEEVDDEMPKIDDFNAVDVLSKMKDRPLPAPPRPPRAAKRKKKTKQQHVENDFDMPEKLHLDVQIGHDYGSVDNLEDELLHRQLIREIAGDMVDDIIQNAEKQVEQTNIDEQEMWTQTDPLPDDFICEDEVQHDEVIMKDVFKDKEQIQDINSFSTIERNKDDSKKHKEDSSRSSLDPADVEKARKIADAESLTRGLRRFRDTSRQRTFSSSRTPSERAMSEHALLLERTLVTPTKTEDTDLLLTQATLLVRPVDDELDIDDLLEEEAREEKRKHLHGKAVVDETFQIPEKETFAMPIDDYCQDETNILADADIVPEIQAAEEPPIPMKRRSSLKKSRSIPTHETELDKAPDPKMVTSTEISTEVIERRTDLTVDTTSKSEIEVLKTNRLQVSNLDVENLNVSQLQANSIKVSEVDGMAMQVKELNSKSGNLVVTGIDIAPTIIQEIIGRLTPTNVHSTAQISTQTDEPYEQPSEEKKETVQEFQLNQDFPPTAIQIDPSLYFSQNPYMQQGLYYPHPASIPPASFYTLRPPDLSEEEVQVQTIPKQTRRRHVPKKESTSEEEQQEIVTRHRRVGTRSPEPSIHEITGQLVQACSNSVQRNIRHIWNAIKTKTNTEERKREIQIALIVLLVFTAGLIMIALSDNKTVHHHHWEFFNPPSSDKNA